ncbi:MAG: type III pantothenate kinase [Bulleidia sp.]
MERIITADIGGTNIKLAVFENGTIVQTDEIPTDAKDGAHTVIQRVIRQIEQYGRCDAIGISTCGQVRNGSIHYANENMPGYTGFPLEKTLHDHFHVPVSVENDVICAAVGEHAFGSAKGCDDFLVITFGTGIGAGIFLNGKPYQGNGRNAGIMVGGMITHACDSLDPWEGSFERHASTTALIQKAVQIHPDYNNGRILFEHLNEPQVRDCVEQWCKEAAIGLCSITHVYNLPLLVLGGGILSQPFVYDTIVQQFHTHLIPGFAGTEIRKAGLSNQAGVYGAYVNAYALVHA